MNREKISKNDYNIIAKQLVKHQNEGRISHEQMVEMLKTYNVMEGISFVKVLVTIGAILIGLGILSFIASNWLYLGKLAKFIIIVAGYLSVNLFSYFYNEKYPKTARSFYYLGIMIFGSGIYLVEQMFNFGSHFTNSFLLWGIGIFPLIALVKDKWVFAFLHLLFLIYLNGLYTEDQVAVVLFFFIPLLYVTQYLIKSKLNFFLSSVLVLNLLWIILDVELNVATDLLLFVYFLLGLVLFINKIPFYKEVIRLLGNIIFAVAGFFLTFDFVWKQSEIINVPINLIFSVSYVLILLYLIQRQNLLSLVFLGVTIFRFYFDIMYDFLDKSIFFLVGGIILLAFGYFFERKRSFLRRGESEK